LASLKDRRLLADRELPALDNAYSVQLPERFTIQDGPFKTDAEFNELFPESQHGSEALHLIRICDALPNAYVVHRMIRAINANVVGEIQQFSFWHFSGGP